MAAQPSESLKQLEQDVLVNGPEYEFFQAYRLLESVNQSYPVSPRRPARKIEVRPELSMAYTESDISQIVPLDKNRGYEIISQLPGLYGVASPLPDFYNEELLDNEWDELNAPREFLDIIHRQLFPKLYQAWRLYKLNINTLERSNDSYWNLLYSLMGDPDVEDSKLKHLKLRYFSLFSNKERSAAGLKAIISDFLDLEDVEINEFVEQQVPISDHLRCRIGMQNHQLGAAHLGSKIYDQTMKICVQANNLTELQYSNITNDGDLLESLRLLIQHYLKKPLQVDLIFTVLMNQPELQLGVSNFKLGVTSHLGQTGHTKEILVKLLD